MPIGQAHMYFYPSSIRFSFSLMSPTNDVCNRDSAWINNGNFDQFWLTSELSFYTLLLYIWAENLTVTLHIPGKGPLTLVYREQCQQPDSYGSPGCLVAAIWDQPTILYVLYCQV